MFTFLVSLLMHGWSDSKGQTASCSDDSQADVARAWVGSVGPITYLLGRLADRESSIECAGFIRKLVCKEDRSSSKMCLELLPFTFFFQTGFTGYLSFCWFETTNKQKTKTWPNDFQSHMDNFFFLTCYSAYQILKSLFLNDYHFFLMEKPTWK